MTSGSSALNGLSLSAGGSLLLPLPVALCLRRLCNLGDGGINVFAICVNRCAEFIRRVDCAAKTRRDSTSARRCSWHGQRACYGQTSASSAYRPFRIPNVKVLTPRFSSLPPMRSKNSTLTAVSSIWRNTIVIACRSS